MKTLTALICSLLFMTQLSAQNPSYKMLWQQVEQLEMDGKPKSALEIVDRISVKANQENNAPQHIKTLVFKSKFAIILEEDAVLKVINEFNAEIERTQAPTKNVLQNMLAKLYWDYFQQNRYKFYNRTKTENKVDEVDFRTWDLETLFAEISTQYQKSLANGLLLQMTAVSDYEPILTSFQESANYRPTLYDLLSHNALQFFKTTENSIAKPAYKFELTDPNYLTDAKQFSSLRIESQDSTSLQLLALKTYQNLIKFHQSKNNALALADVNIQRLGYVKQNGRFIDLDTLYLAALEGSKSKVNDGYVKALYDYAIAELFHEQGNSYTIKENETHRWKKKEALVICQELIRNFPESLVAQNAETLKKEIETPSLAITTESNIPSHTESRMLVDYKNYDTIFVTAYPISIDQKESLQRIYNQSQRLEFIKKLSVANTWNSPLTNEGDFQNHKTEISFPGLPNGLYVLLARAEESKEHEFALGYVQFTNLALVEQKDKDQLLFQVIDRTNGKPLQDASCAFKYYRNNRKGLSTKNVVTNHLGEVRIDRNNNRNGLARIEIKHAGEKAYFRNNNYYYSNRYSEEKTTYNAFLFTDRSIYRPGQTVYFKGIVVKREGDQSKVVPNTPVTLLLSDVNGEEVGELKLKTNDYGSVAGEFIVPSGGVTGSYELELYSEGKNVDFETQLYVSVEEYKRPKFEATFQPITESYLVNDSIKITGSALAFAGSTISDAKVSYRVKRKVRYPRWYYYYRSYTPRSEGQEITFGETTTNAKGDFEITFKALPDLKAEKASLPIFNYEVTADITDLNGETQSTTTTVNVGYHTLLLKLQVPEQLDKDKKKQVLGITSENLNNQGIPAKGTLEVFKLKAPDRVLRPRPWEAPDYPGFTATDFKKRFPHDAFTTQANPTTWERGEQVLSTSFDTEKSKEIALGTMKRWESGRYVIIAKTQDAFGQKIEEKAYTSLFSKKEEVTADNALFSVTQNKSTYDVGDQVVLTFGSAGAMNVTVSVEKYNQIVSTQVLSLDNNTKEIKLPVIATDLGGFSIHYSYAAYNSYGSGVKNIAVPFPSRELHVETTTFRDKLQPGTPETWSFKIKGPKGEKVSAELLASMYDVSLDQFKPHNWQFTPHQNRVYRSNGTASARSSFGTEQFQLQLDRYRYGSSYRTLDYDRFNWFGFALNPNSWQYRQYLHSLRTQIKGTYSAKVAEGTVSGTIHDENGSPMPGVSIIVKGTTNGTQTDFEGNFSIVVKKGELLEISYLGYASEEIKINKKNSFEIYLNPDGASLDEVVVTGRGIKREKKALGYAVSTVAAEEVADDFEIAENSEGNVERLLNGNAPGVNVTNAPEKPNFDDVKIRKNLQETAFFFPQLRTDEKGNVSFNFTTPEALTRWKVQLLSHMKTLESAVTTLETVTQKELMVLPNTPRFLREGDLIVISSKISNLTKKELSGQAILRLTDPITGKPLDNALDNVNAVKDFSVAKKGNTQVSWNLKIPNGVQAVQYQIIAKAGDYSDGEQNALPVLSNRMLVTETLPMWVGSNATKTFTLDKLKNNSSTTLTHHKLTLEVTSNPAWYAVQALPYLMEYPYECNEQTFARYYANSLASHIANSNPRIQEVFTAWKNSDALLSNLEKNEELKSLLIQETPWLRDAQSEAEQKKRIALLFDLNKMDNELLSAVNKLENGQMSSGAWPWFNGGYESRYITQHIATGFGHLQQLGVTTTHIKTDDMISRAVSYLDKRFIQEYNDLSRYNKDVDYKKDHLSYTQLHYLYMRSFFPEIKQSKKVKEITTYYLEQIDAYWNERTLYAKGMMALVAHRNNREATANKILVSLEENSITSEELGMYWKENTASWYWYQAPIETQALMIEAFAEIGQDTKIVDELKVWLLKNKQTSRWKTTKATTEAVYALLLQGSDWLSLTEMVDVTVGDQKIDPTTLENVSVEAGTGYFKTSWNTSEIKEEQATVTLSKKGNGVAWGGLYWQYFENLDKITTAETPLQLKKKLFLKTNTDRGESLSEITETTHLHLGDLIRVRIELKVDRAIDYVHMKDLRAAGLEPINVLSHYKYQDGLGYYEATKDASINFFFERLPKGVFVFEYDLRVNNAGDFGNGITTIQCMYAPEFSSHSEGVRIKVAE